MEVHVIDNRDNDTGDLRAALDASGVVGTWDWDLTAKTFRFDRGAAAILAGHPELAGQNLAGAIAAACVHPADIEWLAHDIKRLIGSGGLFLAEFRVFSADGHIRWMLSRGRISLDDLGRAVRARGVLIDITESREVGHGYVARPRSGWSHPLDEAASLCLQAHDCLNVDGTPFLRMLINTVLLELGHELARRVKTQDGR